MKARVLLKRNRMLLIITTVALLLRLINLGRYDLWYDEICSMTSALIKDIPHFSTAYYIHQPLYNIFLKYWQVFGADQFTIRLSSAMAGAISVWFCFFLGRELFSRRAGLLSAFFLAVSPLHIYYSQEARVYSLIVLLAILSTYFLAKFLRTFSFPCLYLSIGCNVLNVYLNYTAVLIVIAQVIFLSFYVFSRTKKLLFKVIIAELVQLMLLTPFLYIFAIKFNQMLNFPQAQDTLTVFSGSAFFQNIFYTFKNFCSGYYSSKIVRFASFSLMGTLFAISVIKHSGIDRKKTIGIILLFFLPMLILLLISQYKFFFADRYVLSSLVFFLLFIACGLEREKKVIRNSAVAAICLLSFLSLQGYYAGRLTLPYKERPGVPGKKGFKQAALHLANNYQYGDLILHTCENSTLPIEYYMDPAPRKKMLYDNYLITNKFIEDCFIERKEKIIVHDPVLHTFSCYNGPEMLNDALKRFSGGRVWLVLSSWEQPCSSGEKIKGRLENTHVLVSEKVLEGVEILLYQ